MNHHIRTRLMLGGMFAALLAAFLAVRSVDGSDAASPPPPRRAIPRAAAAPRVWEVDLQTRTASHPPESQAVGFVAPDLESPPPEFATLLVDVVDAEGRPADDAWAIAVSCPGFDGGPAGEYDVESGPCALRAERRDGLLVAHGPVETVVVGGPDPAYVQLELPARRSGGIGIRFEAVDEGMRVLSVVEGTPAERIGLLPGDLIVAVSGTPVAGMPLERFVEEVTGEEGTAVDLTVAGSDSGLAANTVRVTRAFLEG